MARVIVFDVNETLLDLKALEPLFVRLFDDAGIMPQWFARMLHSSLIVTMTGAYTDFGSVGMAALEATAARQGHQLSDGDRREIVKAMGNLPPHPDVIPSLERLREAGLRLAALTNSSPHMVVAQLTNSGLREYFEMALTVDQVRRFKPAPEVYRMAAEQLGIETGQMRMVAAHDWDVFGALRAGCAAAFMARPGAVYNSLYEKPDVVGSDLIEVTDKILELEL